MISEDSKNYGEQEAIEVPPDLLRRLQGCRTLPSVPAVVVQVLDMAANMDSIGAADMAQVVARDPAIATRILKVANSARYSISHDVSTIEQAIAMLGLAETMNLALSFSLVRELKSKSNLFYYQQYWRRSVISAVATAETGSLLQISNRDELFITGLISDIGILALSETLPEYGRQLASSLNDHFRLIEIEHNDLQTDHATVGAWLLHRWGLPRHLVCAVRDSHISEKSDSPLTNAVALSSRIADICMNAESIETLEKATDVAGALFSMDHMQFDRLLTKTADVFPEMTADMDTELGDEFEINKLLDQSRSALAEINVQMIREARKLVVQAQHDSLTRLYNRSYLEQNLENQFAISINTGQPLTVIFVDVDHFKGINDNYGHASGDVVLIEVARAIQAAIRNYDTAVRYGGDEFIALLMNAPQDTAHYVSERIRSTIADRTFNISDGVEITATVSVGYATLTHESLIKTAAELLEAADKRLYVAKSSGRNRVA